MGSKGRPIAMLLRNRARNREVGQRIRRLRRKLGLTQVQLGRLLERKDAQGAAFKIESGKIGLFAEDLSRVAAVLGTSLDYLIDGEGPEFEIANNNAAPVTVATEPMPSDEPGNAESAEILETSCAEPSCN